MYFKYISLFIFSFFIFESNAQVSPIVDIDFNNCTIVDNGSLNSGISILGNAGCDCGLIDESLEFDGNDDALTLDSKINSYFNNDFTIEFYFSIFNTQDIVDIFSFKNECSSDSSFSLQYLPSIKELRFYTKESDFETVELDLNLDVEKCWHHIAIVRKGFEYFMLLDGEKIGIENAGRKFTFASDNVFSFANSPCITENNINYSRFRGRIDQFKVYNYALNEIVLNDIAIPSDMILNQDTTIFLGSGIDIEMGPTCADNFNWTNKQDLSDSDILKPTITPSESNVYYIYFIMNGKSCYDSIYIHVQDKDALDCEKLLLPNSFTPNDDGLNDRLEISNKFIIEEMKSFDIYDRWGTRVFSTVNENESWDGMYQNEKINPGKFVYKVSYVCKEKEYLKQGILNLIR